MPWPNSAQDSSTPNHLNSPGAGVEDVVVVALLVVVLVDVTRVVEIELVVGFVVEAVVVVVGLAVVVVVVDAVSGKHWK